MKISKLVTVLFLMITFLFVPTDNVVTYKERIGYLESRGDYCATNGTHFGKYQFSMITVKGLIKNGLLEEPDECLTVDYFLNNPAYQEKTMNASVYHCHQLLTQMGLYRFVGKKVRGIRITRVRLFGALHGFGPYATRDFLKTGSLKPAGKAVKVDRFGHSIIDRMKLL